MRTMLRTIRIIAILYAALPAFAGMAHAELKKVDTQLIQTLMTKAGLSKQLDQIPLIIQAGMVEANQETNSLSPEALQELSEMAARAFDANMLKETVLKHIQANLAEEDTRAVLAWLNSPLGNKILKMDEKSSSPEAYIEMLKMADKLSVNTVRVDLVKKLDQAVKATETGVAAAMNTQTALIVALTGKMRREERPTFEAIENEVKKNRGELQTAVEEQNVLGFLYSYRDLTDAEINEYLRFAESAPGQKYHAVVSAGFTNALAGAAHELGSQVESSDPVVPDVEKKEINSTVMYSQVTKYLN